MKTARKKTYLPSFFVRLTFLYLLIFQANLKTVTASPEVPDFYYYYTEKIPLRVSTKMIMICFEDSTNKMDRDALVESDPALKGTSDEKLPYGLVLVTTREGLDKEDIAHTIERLNKLTQIKYSTPVFQFRHLKLILRMNSLFASIRI